MTWWPLRCRHVETYRERRRLAGTELLVMHFICNDCGYARPMMHRTTDEHAEIVARRPVTQHAVPMTLEHTSCPQK